MLFGLLCAMTCHEVVVKFLETCHHAKVLRIVFGCLFGVRFCSLSWYHSPLRVGAGGTAAVGFGF